MKQSLSFDTMYLHHPEGEFRTHCVIAAHGIYLGGWFGDDRFEIPAGVKLVFYSRHGDTVEYFGIDNFLGHIHEAQPPLSDGKTFNYVLSKYQASHKKVQPPGRFAEETYDVIGNAVTRNQQMTRSLGAIEMATAKFNKSSKKDRARGRDTEPLKENLVDSDDFEELKATAVSGADIPFEFPFDVLTVRDRFFSGRVTLKTALNALLRVHKYENVHCYFCRKIAGKDRPKPESTAEHLRHLRR